MKLLKKLPYLSKLYDKLIHKADTCLIIKGAKNMDVSLMKKTRYAFKYSIRVFDGEEGIVLREDTDVLADSDRTIMTLYAGVGERINIMNKRRCIVDEDGRELSEQEAMDIEAAEVERLAKVKQLMETAPDEASGTLHDAVVFAEKLSKIGNPDKKLETDNNIPPVEQPNIVTESKTPTDTVERTPSKTGLLLNRPNIEPTKIYSVNGEQFKTENGKLYHLVWDEITDYSEIKIISRSSSRKIDTDKYVVYKKVWKLAEENNAEPLIR